MALSNTNTPTSPTFPFRIRTITAFTCLTPDDFDPLSPFGDDKAEEGQREQQKEPKRHKSVQKTGSEIKISECAAVLKFVEEVLVKEGYEVQTTRIATNSFSEYLLPCKQGQGQGETRCNSREEVQRRLDIIDASLHEHQIELCSLGPAIHPDEVLEYCPIIVRASHRFSCTVQMRSGTDVVMARRTAECMQLISKMGSSDADRDAPSHVKNGLGNFRFCATACCKPNIPFFPGAKGPSLYSLTPTTTAASATTTTPRTSLSKHGKDHCVSFAIGLENGKFAQQLLSQTTSIEQISTVFSNGMAQALLPIQTLCDSLPQNQPKPTATTTETTPKTILTTLPSHKFLGFDTSLNPSLEHDGGSVASAIEKLPTVATFGHRGTLAVASEITRTLQSLPQTHNVRCVGYQGLMLPVCEDRRLVELARAGKLATVHLLSVSGVCGVGLDTVPVAGDVKVEDLMGLVLDVAGLAFRWDKQLSCRLLICPGKSVGEETDFDSRWMCNCPILSAE